MAIMIIVVMIQSGCCFYLTAGKTTETMNYAKQTRTTFTANKSINDSHDRSSTSVEQLGKL